jgi:hypothetical protein
MEGTKRVLMAEEITKFEDLLEFVQLAEHKWHRSISRPEEDVWMDYMPVSVCGNLRSFILLEEEVTPDGRKVHSLCIGHEEKKIEDPDGL